MNFRTKFHQNPSDHKLNYSDSLFFTGSCFSNNISKILKRRKFNTISNPFGILYNPVSVLKNLENIISKKKYTQKDIFLKDEIWNCFDFHSDMSGTNKEIVLENINTQIKSSHNFLAKTNTLFITFGTAWVYEKNEKVVANCFKLDTKSFNKRLLSIEEIFLNTERTINTLKNFNKDIKVVFTVSPVRHLKDGFIENNQSKSTLILAINRICQSIGSTSYFPAYELLIDDLRDYRFFKEDMVHPNKIAIDYILEKFDQYYFDTATIQKIKKIENVNNSLAHKVRFKDTISFLKFKSSLNKKIEALEKIGFDFEKEKESLNKI